MSVIIKKTGITAIEWDSNEQAYVEKDIKHSYHELRNSCSIESDVTLRDIIEIVGRDKELKELIENYSWCDVDAFVQEVRVPTSKKSDLLFIELKRIGTINNHRKSGDSYEEFIDVSGRDNSETHWAIDFTPVNEMADLPIKLHSKIEIKDWRNIGEIEGRDSPETIVEAAHSITLLEVLSEIFFEISFHGSPQERTDRSLDLQQAVEEIKAGTAELVPFEEGFKDKETIQ